MIVVKNLKRTIEDHHPEPGLPESITRVISSGGNIKILDDFPAWKAA